jgi:hypothetical protein
VQVFTASGTFVQPPGVTAIEVFAVGGGQGGAGFRTAYAGNPSFPYQIGVGGGGGGAQVLRRTLPVISDIVVTVGAGGLGGQGGTGADNVQVLGAPGGDTILSGGAVLTAKGGGHPNGNGPGLSYISNDSGGTTVVFAGGGGASGDRNVTIPYEIANDVRMEYLSDNTLGTLYGTDCFPGFKNTSANEHNKARGKSGIDGYGGGGCGALRALNSLTPLARGIDGSADGIAYANQIHALNGGNATPNTGAGGGGASSLTTGNPSTQTVNGGNGAAGIVIIKWWE